MKDMFAMGRFLFIVTAIAGVMLALTESVTAPNIKRNREKAFEEARQSVLPKAKRFETSEIFADSATQTFFLGFDENNDFVGVVQTASPKGYGGEIEMMVGLNADNSFSDVKIMSLRETPGLGTKLNSETFLTRFLEVARKTTDASRLRVKQEGGDVDAITAATISSKAFCSGIRESVGKANRFAQEIRTSAVKLGSGGGK